MTVANSGYLLAQSTPALSSRFAGFMQKRSVAVAALAISTVVAVISAAVAALATFGLIEEYIRPMLSGKMKRKYCDYMTLSLTATAGVGTFFGVSVGLSKLLKSPFSRANSIAITLATIGALILGLLWYTGIGSIMCQTID